MKHVVTVGRTWILRLLNLVVHIVNTLFFNILLIVHHGMIPVNNQLDAQFFKYVYFYPVHVSGTHVRIIRRIIVSVRHLVYVTLCR